MWSAFCQGGPLSPGQGGYDTAWVDARVRTKVRSGFRKEKGLLRVIPTPGLGVKALVSHSSYIGWNKSQKEEGVFKVSSAPVP